MDLLEDFTKTQRAGVREGRRTGVLLVAGVGAALLTAAAALFVAVRWNDIPAEAKLAVMLAVTAIFLLAGESLRKTLPTTGNVLFHLGAFLLPVDVGAVNLRLGMSWQELLLTEGIFCTVAFGVLSRIGRSRVLEFAAGLGVVATAFGIGAVSPIPGPVALAVAAAALAIYRPRSTTAVAWAMTAAAGPMFVLALRSAGAAPDALVELGLGNADRPLLALLTGVLTAGVIGRAAHLGRDAGLAFLAFGAFGVSVATSWISADLGPDSNFVGVAAAFAAIQAIALGIRRDPFWSSPTRSVASASELFAAISLLPVFGLVLLAPFAESGFVGGSSTSPRGTVGSAFALLAFGWAGSILRRIELGSDRLLVAASAVFAAVSAVVAVQTGTASTIAISLSMVAVAGALVLVRHPLTSGVAIAFAVYAPLTAHAHPQIALACGLVGAIVLTAAAMDASRRGLHLMPASFVVGALSSLALCWLFAARLIDAPVAGLAFVACCFLVAFAVDTSDRDLAYMPRLAALGVVLPAMTWTSNEQLIVFVPLLALLVIDAVRRSDVALAYLAVFPLQLTVFNIASVARLDLAEAGIVMCVAAIVWAGLSEAIDGMWRRPLEAATIAGLVVGSICAAADPAAFGVTLLIAGSLAVSVGLLRGVPAVVHAGGVLLIVGTWIELVVGDVRPMEAYVAPVAAHLFLAGLYERSRHLGRASSWLAYGPAIALLGGSGLIERINGGNGWHAIIAGGVGVLAVAVGGGRRLAGPIVIGTCLLGAVTIFESLAVVATVPTWAWLALAGSALVSTAIALERTDTSPMDAGRRVVDVLATNFE